MNFGRAIGTIQLAKILYQIPERRVNICKESVFK
jgi:hypothetical protein